MRKVRVQDLLLESVVSILNLTARRIAKEDERDLEQARIGIDAVRGLRRPARARGRRRQVREALSELQMLYAREAAGGGERARGRGARAAAPSAAAGRAATGSPRPRGAAAAARGRRRGSTLAATGSTRVAALARLRGRR